MESVLRVEVIVASFELPALCERLRAEGIGGYTIVPGVRGHGDRGDRDADDVSGTSENGYLLTTCLPDQLQRIVEAIRPVLARAGGECLVSDASRIKH